MDQEEEDLTFDLSSPEENEEDEVQVEKQQDDSDSALERTSTKLDTTEPVYSLKRYFEYLRGSTTAKCRICSGKLKRTGGSPTGMIRHLEKTHPTMFKAYDSAKKDQEQRQSTKRDRIASEAGDLNFIFYIENYDYRKFWHRIEAS